MENIKYCIRLTEITFIIHYNTNANLQIRYKSAQKRMVLNYWMLQHKLTFQMSCDVSQIVQLDTVFHLHKLLNFALHSKHVKNCYEMYAESMSFHYYSLLSVTVPLLFYLTSKLLNSKDDLLLEMYQKLGEISI